MPRAGTAAYLREHDMDRVAVVEADLVGRLVGPDGAADRVQEQDGLGVERVLAAQYMSMSRRSFKSRLTRKKTSSAV
jgi:hypothetical protein